MRCLDRRSIRRHPPLPAAGIIALHRSSRGFAAGGRFWAKGWVEVGFGGRRFALWLGRVSWRLYCQDLSESFLIRMRASA
jgi:hypothetical protein